MMPVALRDDSGQSKILHYKIKFFRHDRVTVFRVDLLGILTYTSNFCGIFDYMYLVHHVVNVYKTLSIFSALLHGLPNLCGIFL